MNQVQDNKVQEKPKTINLTEIDTLFLHAPMIIDGKTETTVHKGRVPTIKRIYWNESYTAITVEARRKHVLPSAAVKDSILVD